MFTLIEHGEVHAPAPRGRTSVFLAGDRIAHVGAVDRADAERFVRALGHTLDVVDATGCVVTPGLIDPHEHLLGGSGEKGFSSQTPEIALGEIVTAGITTVVGCLGVDTTMKTMAGLLAKVKGLREEGMGAYCWSGGYNVPPTSILASVREDILFIEEVIGAGEIAIADERASDPGRAELARLVTDAYVGGMLARKAGVTHFHVGEGDARLALLRALVAEHDVEPAWLYVTHIERSEALVDEAIALVAQGATADVDTIEEDLAQWVRYWRAHGGDPARLTVSSDASISSPHTMSRQLRGLVTEHGMALEDVLPLATTNTARVLQLADAGELAPGKLADVLVMRQEDLEIVHVLARGRPMVRDGRLCVQERFREGSNRRIHIDGSKA
jgi:beta-aspartyl-dipeptidase (metallo-type)